ncbi:cache domain-containing protein [Candidatus Pandoraea novymonadis]|uniref:histidine kinase n=1 Tax=Candidatus Pandoraea novymonadis TaxID=1808959 RepID=A0ABX5FG91_9BURK|nr:cache domain-containing protein [Candidatus Pandoraea novymonadis]PSB92445.1 Signal transduction histidine-protein kinase/phosphatase DegS [Candidatus Pandoraea novymonadis]
MNSRQKFWSLVILPASFALIAITLMIFYQAIVLSRQQLKIVERTYLSAKEIELKNHVKLACNIVELLHNGPDTPELRKAIIDTLSRLSVGQENYFFIYDLNGESLIKGDIATCHSQYIQEIQDVQNESITQYLIEKGKAGGGLVRYMRKNPSSKQIMSKFSYVIKLNKWNWIIGSNLCSDDVQITINKLTINLTLLWTTLIGACCFMAAGIAGLVVNFISYCNTDLKLKKLARQVVQSREIERTRISRDLHDGISQLLVSVKLLLESTAMQIMNAPAAANLTLSVAIEHLNNVLMEVRRISKALGPAMLDELGIGDAIEKLGLEFGQHAHLTVEVIIAGEDRLIDHTLKTVLFRITQEALTNINRHANAKKITISLMFDKDGILLDITDNGAGFDNAQDYRDPKWGIGLRNMHERLETIGGVLKIQSRSGATTIHVWVPLPQSISS